ncbi:MAG: hypothetical protein LCH63_10245 [Candidatus Melainabacteria bacterium]|nr:hypothetical protein [Candidatus Melainabacteria bacterium]
MKALILIIMCLCFCQPARADNTWLDDHPKAHKVLWFASSPFRLMKRFALVPARELTTGYRILVFGENPEHADAIAGLILEDL